MNEHQSHAREAMPPSLIEEEKSYYEYTVIKSFYGDQTAKRSGLPLMNHIDEGLAFLKVVSKAAPNTKKAWCIHPIVQAGLWPWRKIDVAWPVLDIANAYSRYANAYLSPRHVQSLYEIACPLSVDEPEHQMLVADKVQNRKDYEQYQEPNGRLDNYFNKWLKRLGVKEEYPDWRMWLLSIQGTL